MKRHLLLAVLVLTTGAFAFGQAPPPVQPPPRPVDPPPPVRPVETQVRPADPVRPVEKDATTSTFRAKQVLGTKVMLSGEATAGTVEDLVFDQAGNLDYLIVDTNGKLATVPWDAVNFNVEKKTAVLTLTEEKFKAVPTYTTTTYPDFYAPTYRTDIYKVYGLTPRELRKFERRNR